jgi:tRNA-dihydrouridine synthase A
MLLPIHKLCIAPMMTHTDRHFRYFLRLLTRHTMLYTEMLTTGALLHGDAGQLMVFSEAEHPIGMQLGGSDPGALAQCAVMAEAAGYDEINLNVGCPSDRVQSGRFGACLMLEPETVAECISAMQARVNIPVTVKCRIGVDHSAGYPFLANFIRSTSAAGCKTFFIHARKAWLQGLSPRQNREVPPLDYDLVYRIKQDFPDLEIIINGGINTLEQAVNHCNHVDGAMIGRAACNNPFLLARADRIIFGTDTAAPQQKEVLRQYLDYVEAGLQAGIALSKMTRNLTGLFQGRPGARAFRRYLGENIHDKAAGIEVMERAMNLVDA